MKKKPTPKATVLKTWPTARARSPRPRGLYYNQWNIVVPPEGYGLFGPMEQILGKGATAGKAWADAAATKNI
jgi:hypothetical protein